MPANRKVRPAANVKWVDPPQSNRGRKRGSSGSYAFYEALKSRPNTWALYRKDAPSATPVTVLAKRHPKTEWTSRKQRNGKFTIYGRYIGS